MSTNFLAALLLVPLAALADEPFLWSPAYESLDEAAVAALDEAVYMASTHDSPVEYVGIVYQLNGHFLFTVPQTSGKKYGARQAIRFPKAATVAALFHNHPPGRGNDQFSPKDVEEADERGVPVYITVLGDETGTVRKYVPGESEIYYLDAMQEPYSKGEILKARLASDEIEKTLANN